MAANNSTSNADNWQKAIGKLRAPSASRFYRKSAMPALTNGTVEDIIMDLHRNGLLLANRHFDNKSSSSRQL